TPAAARQTAPASPAGCWQASCVPSHSSRLQGLPSSVHAVPAGSFASPGQVALEPVQCSAGSHSPAEARQTVVEGSKALAGQAVLVRAEERCAGQAPAAAAHTDPALTAGGRRGTHGPGVAGRVLAVVVVPVAVVAAAGVVVVGARRPGRVLRVGRTGGARAGAVLRRVALARRGAADGRRGLEGVGRAGGARARAGYGDVAGPGCRADDGPGVARRAP